jgi:serine/arginine repetitive matrix protein 2
MMSCLEPSENWDDDFEFGQGNGRPSTSSNRKSHSNQPRRRPSNDTQRRASSATNGRTFSMASSTMEDWDLPETPETNHHPTSTTAEHTENWDDDFEVETRNNSPRKPKLSTPRRRDVREESWDDELELEAKRGDLDAEFGRRDEEDRTVTARSRRAALSRFAPPNPSPPPPMPFFPSNNQHPSPEPFPRSPTASVFSVPNTIYTYSSSTPLVYGSYPRPMSSLALLPPSPPIHKERERRRLRKKSRPLREGTIELVDMAGRYSFSDGEGSARNARSATPSDVSSVDERHKYHPVLEPTPPLPTQPSISAMPSAPGMTASGSAMTMPATPTKGGATLMSRIGSVKKWGVRRRRGTSSTPSEVIGRLFSYYSFFFQSFSNLLFLLSAESQSPEAPDRTPRPKTSMSSFTRELSTSPSYPSTPNGTSSAADTQHTHTHWFFRASSSTGSPGVSSSARPGSSGRDSIGHKKQRRSTSRTRTRDRDVGDTHAGAPGSSSSRRPPPVTGSGDWNASRTSLRLAVGLQRESVMENSPSSSRPSSPLASMQGVSERKTRVSYSGRRPSISGVNTQAAAAERTQTPMTPSKLVKRKSLGFVRLGFGGGNAHATEGKYPGLGLGLGRRAADSDDEEEDYGHQQQRTRRKSFSKLLLDRDKSKDREDHETPLKEGSRGFMNSVRRISLVGKHKRASRVVSYRLRRPSRVGGYLIAAAVVEKELTRPRCHIPSRPSRIRQVSCRCGFLKNRGRLLVCISISSRSTIQIYISPRDGSFLLLRVVAKPVQCFLRRRSLEALDLFLDRVRGAQVWGWVEVCSEHRLGRLGSGPSRGRGGRKMGSGNSKEAWLARDRLHVDPPRRIDEVSILCLIPRVRSPSRFCYHPLSFNRLRRRGRSRRRLLNRRRRRRWLRQKARSRSRRVIAGRIIRVLWRLPYRRSTCIRYRLEHFRLYFRQYRLHLYRLLLWRRRERRSLRLRRHHRLRCFLHQLGRLFRLRHRTSLGWGLLVTRRGNRACH